MRFRNIEVSGIERIVFNRKTMWSLINGGRWQKRNTGNFPDTMPPSEVISHSEMMCRVNNLKKDPRYQMWIHFDTLNIVRKKDVKKPSEQGG
jgi:hypothetical protein